MVLYLQNYLFLKIYLICLFSCLLTQFDINLYYCRQLQENKFSGNIPKDLSGLVNLQSLWVKVYFHQELYTLYFLDV